MVDSSAPSRSEQITLPSLQFLTEMSAFMHDFDHVRAYDIPPSITSIEWLNRQTYCNNMTFAVANDKKIRLFKLRNRFVEDFRGSGGCRQN